MWSYSKSLTVFTLITIVNILVSEVKCHAQLKVGARRSAFDPSLYEEALDPEECNRQLAITRSDLLLRLQFLDAGLRIPKGILAGNLVDLGNYHQCLGINQEMNNSTIEGKYCTLSVPLSQSLTILSLPVLESTDEIEWQEGIERSLAPDFSSRLQAVSALGDKGFTLAVCVPKVCTTREGLDGLLLNTTAIGFQYEDISCRLNNDKPWVAGDYVAVVIFSIIGVLVLLSTIYERHCILIQKREPKSVSTVGSSFSVYTNARRLTTFVPQPGALECIDGIRALSMMWIIVVHTFHTLPAIINGMDVLEWKAAMSSFWVTEASISVDTFFMLSGLLLVYTTMSKMSGMELLKNLHLFYLNRLFRMFPLLAAAILCQISIFHRLSDGPMWQDVALQTDICRSNWWVTMLYLQNFIFPTKMCLQHTWYLAIDMQLHILSPLVLFRVLSNSKKTAWIALTTTLVIYFAANIPYNIIIGKAENINLFVYYYINTLARASPFLVGMVFGYLLHLWRGKKFEMPKRVSILLWIFALTLTTCIVFVIKLMKDRHWDNRTVDSLINSFTRAAWALSLGWIIFACVHGCGGIVNWFLCLPLWKLPSRISYAMYLFHFPIMYVISGSVTAPVYFSVKFLLQKFLSHFTITFIVGFFVTLLIELPFSTLIRLALGEGARKKIPLKEIPVATVPSVSQEGIAIASFSDSTSPPEGKKNVPYEEELAKNLI